MATLERTEGDHAYYSDGSVRWAEGNSQGKTKGAWVKKPPRSSSLWAREGEGLAKAQSASAKGREGMRALQLAALIQAHKVQPDSKSLKQGLVTRYSALVELASSPDAGSHMVRANEHLDRLLVPPEKVPQSVTAVQVVLTEETLRAMARVRAGELGPVVLAGEAPGRLLADESAAEDTENA